MLLEIKVNYFF